ncbi:MAG: efflux transporter outer membrane subunit, partial [Candidimonas sp.]
KAGLIDAQSAGLAAAPFDYEGVQREWWKQFGDPQLDRLVDLGLTRSPTIKLAQARLDHARAQTQAAGAGLGPRLEGQLDATRQRYTENGMVPAPIAGSVRDNGTAQLSASWEIDFFGRQRSLLDAAIGSERAARADAQAARILLATSITRRYVNLARLENQLRLAQRTLAQRTETLDLVRDRVAAGLDTQLELRQSEGGLPESRQQIESLHEQIALERNALAALAGQPRIASTIAATRLDKQAVLSAPRAVPVDLVGRRADIVAARWRVEAAGRDIEHAKTRFYPDVNITAFAGFASLGFGQLFEGASRQWGIGPAIRLPIFESGRLRAGLKSSTADYDAAVEQYNGTLIDAVHQVSDCLVSLEAIERQRTEQAMAQAAAENAYDIARERFKAGLANYLQVLAAETQVLAQRRLSVDLAARELDVQAQLARALGGGYADADADVASKTPPAG